MPRGDQRRLVADVGDVGARETGSLPRQESAVERRVELERTQVHVEDLLALLHVGQSDLDLPVETPGAHQRLVEDVGTVRGRQHDHAGVGLEAVHLREELVERILALVVAGEAGVLAACAADGVDLVDENDAGRLLLGLLERSRTREAPTPTNISTKSEPEIDREGHVGLARHGLRQQRLARARRAHEQRSLRDLGPQFAVFVGLLEEIDDLHDLDLRLLQTGHVLERHAAVVVLVEDLRPGLADIHDAAPAAGPRAARHRAHHEEPHADDEHPRQEIHQQARPVVGRVLVLHRHGGARPLLGLLQILAERIHRADREEQLRALRRQPLEPLVDRILAVALHGLLLQMDLCLLAVDDEDLLHVAPLDHPFDGRPVALHGPVVRLAEEIPADDQRADHAVYPHEGGPRHVDVHLLLIAVVVFRHKMCGYASYSYRFIGASAHSSSSR